MWGVRAAFWFFGGLVAEGMCGVFRPWVHGRESEVPGNRPNRQITADGASNYADISRSWVGTTRPITEKKYYRRERCLWVPPGRDRGRAGCSCEQVPANKNRGDWAQVVERGDGRAILNRCGDRRDRVGWAAMGAGDGNVSSNVSVGTVIVAQMGGVRGVQGAVKPEYELVEHKVL